MFFLTWSHIWILSYFFIFTYIVLFFSILLYVIPILSMTTNLRFKSLSNTSFYIITGSEILFFLILPIICFIMINLFWSSCSLSIWFGHIIFTSFQCKFIYFIILFFMLVLIMLSSIVYFSSSEIYDFFITNYNFMYSALIEMLISILDFFNIYRYKFVCFFNICLMTFDWFLLENIFLYLVSTNSFTNIFTIGLIWFFFNFFSIFLKCSIAPLFFENLPFLRVYLWSP